MGQAGRPKRWTEERIRSELDAFLAGRPRWPSQSEFVQAGQGALLAALARNGGAAAWARRLDFESPAPGGVRDWDEERIRAELAEFLRGRAAFPSRREFYAEGRGTLHGAAEAYRGLAWWRRELGFAARTSGRSRVWSEERIEAELRPLLVDGRFPSRDAFERSGQGALYWAIRRHGGAAVWARKLGVAPPSRGRPPGA